MPWLVMMLHPWAARQRKTLELACELRRRLAREDVEIFYPVDEYQGRKSRSPYEEYLFVEQRDDVDYVQLVDEEFFLGFLTEPNGRFSLVSDDEVERVRATYVKPRKFRDGSTVTILDGSFRGYVGRVIGEEWIGTDHQVLLEVRVGDDSERVAMPAIWLKKRKSK